MADEIELKLAVSPELAPTVRRLPLIRRLAEKRAVSRRLATVYFDTPDQALAKRGIALRIRSIGKRRLQTLKLPAEGPSGLQVQREIETPVEGDSPELDKIADLRLRRLLANEAVTKRLTPVFATEFQRTTWLIDYSGSRIELALDQGEIRCEAGRLPLSEIELELRQGNPQHIFELALALHEALPVTIGTATKAARGFALMSGEQPTAAKAALVGLHGTMSARDAFAAAARNCLAQMQANEAAARLGQDPEGIHQLRVGLRRFRALVTAYRDTLSGEAHELLSRELRWLQQELNPARDWDVFITTTLMPIVRRVPELQPAVEAANELRAMAQTRARATLNSPRYTAMLLRCHLWLATGGWTASEASMLDRPVAEFAGAILQRRHRRLRKFGGKRAALSEGELHRLRLMAKKQRYVGEFFRELFPRKATGKYIAALSAIQDVLGSLNDAMVSRHLVEELERFLAEVPSLGPTAAARGAGVVLGWQAASIAADLGRVTGVWKAFVGRKTFWPRPTG